VRDHVGDFLGYNVWTRVVNVGNISYSTFVICWTPIKTTK
jgi:hypothetical protein